MRVDNIIKITPSTQVRHADDVLMRELDGETIILNLNTSMYLGLDDVATDLFNHLMSTQSVKGAGKALLQEYEVDEATLMADLLVFTEQLLERGLIVCEPGETS